MPGAPIAVHPPLGQPLEPVIAVDLQHAAEFGQMPGRAYVLAVFGVDIGGRRMSRATPRPVIDRVAPQAPYLGPAAAGIEHRQRRVIGKDLGGRALR